MDDEDDIHDRLEQLEATVADQQQTIEQLTEPPAVGRRSVVASLLGAGAVGGLAGYGSQSARAQSGPAGQVGTGEEPVDGFLWDLDVQNGAEFNGSDVTGVGAVEADELSNGVAGDGNTTTRVVADQGDTIPVHSVIYLPSEEVEITSTSFTELGSLADRFVSFPTEFSLQNTGQIRARIAFRVESVDSEVTLRLGGEDDVSLTATGTGGHHTDWVDNIADRSNEHFEGMVDSGSATVRGMTVVYGRQIE